MNKPRLVSLAAFLALALPGIAGAEPGAMLTPSQLLQRALAPKAASLAACGASSATVKAVARFALGFDGRVQHLRVEGVPAGSAAHACVVRELSGLQMPVRLAYIVREIALPLPRSIIAGGSAAR